MLRWGGNDPKRSIKKSSLCVVCVVHESRSVPAGIAMLCIALFPRTTLSLPPVRN